MFFQQQFYAILCFVFLPFLPMVRLAVAERDSSDLLQDLGSLLKQKYVQQKFLALWADLYFGVSGF